MTDAQRAARAKLVAQETTLGYKIRPHSPRWNEVMRLLDEIIAGSAPPPPPPPPPPPTAKLAPQTYNRGGGGQDARYCPSGLSYQGGAYVDAGGYRYDENGLSLGGRSGNPVAGLKPSDQMDGRGPCDPYGAFPPWPAGSYER